MDYIEKYSIFFFFFFFGFRPIFRSECLLLDSSIMISMEAAISLLQVMSDPLK